MELTDTLELSGRSGPRALQLPGLPTKVFVYATGAGCATVQGTITYSTYMPKPENTLLNIQAAIIEEIRPERSSIEDLQGNLPALIIKTCFKWKGKERSGILRLESSLFSGYELHSVNPVVLDGATFADLHYGSRGESVWFVFANISSTCPVCVTYEARSKFIITSLRPAFAKIYPSTRPDLAVETFFHARPGSPLLRGITDDDFITWFDKTELASLKTTASIDNICECGRICSRDYEFRKQKHPDEKTTTVTPAKKEVTTEKAEVEMTTNKVETETESTTSKKVVIPTITTPFINNDITTYQTETNVTGNEATTTKPGTTEAQPSTKEFKQLFSSTKSPEIDSVHVDDPIIIPTVTYLNVSKNVKVDNNIAPLTPATNGDLIVQKVLIPKTIPKKDEIKKKPLPRRKGTLKATYGEKQDSFFNKNKALNNTEVPIEKIKSPKKAKLMRQKLLDTKSKDLFASEKAMGSKIDETVFPTVLPTQASKEDKLTTSKPKEIVLTNPTIAHQESSTQPHNIATITKSNIKNIHYRTKKPKAATQIKKPLVNITQTELATQKSDSQYETKANKTKIKNVLAEKHVTKMLKSINKEIHKIPPTPISETSKTLADDPKSDIAPENRGGFEILDKNRLWELLKEGSDVDSTKIDDKLQVHNRLILAQNVSTINDNRSL